MSGQPLSGEVVVHFVLLEGFHCVHLTAATPEIVLLIFFKVA